MIRLSVTLLLSCILSASVVFAQGSPGAEDVDPFAEAAARISLDIYRIGDVPEGFTLAGIELMGGTAQMMLATYVHPEGRVLYMMQTSPEGMDCPECPTIEIDGKRVPYESITDEDGTRIVDITLIQGGTAVALALSGPEDSGTGEMLNLLIAAAKSLQRVSSVAPSTTAQRVQGIAEAASKASFPVYAPDWLPQYFFLKTVSYSPELVDEQGERATTEQVTITYADATKNLHILIQPADTFQLPSGSGVSRMTIQNWPAAVEKKQDGVVVSIKAPDAMIVLSGAVQEVTLLRAGRSLKKVSE